MSDYVNACVWLVSCNGLFGLYTNLFKNILIACCQFRSFAMESEWRRVFFMFECNILVLISNFILYQNI